MPDNDDNDGFTTVSFKYRKPPTGAKKKKGKAGKLKYTQQGKEYTKDDLLKLLQRYRDTLTDCAFYEKTLPLIEERVATREIKDIVCYGIGSMEDSIPARYQFMLILLLQDKIKHTGAIYIFDPVMTAADKEVCAHYGLQVIDTNEDCKRRVDCATLFYMPHCTREHYNNVLAANWEPELLAHITLIGNDLTDMYVTSQSDRVLREKCPFLLPASAILQSIPFPAHLFDINNVFNNTSIQFFPTPIKPELLKTPSMHETKENGDNESK
ncbi:SRR1-domain-containing protein [Gongronella butleri]|nr:SRR1-domain-containing protein [Gongronella butleri]